jgi:hypothetical protein
MRFCSDNTQDFERILSFARGSVYGLPSMAQSSEPYKKTRKTGLNSFFLLGID